MLSEKIIKIAALTCNLVRKCAHHNFVPVRVGILPGNKFPKVKGPLNKGAPGRGCPVFRENVGTAPVVVGRGWPSPPVVLVAPPEPVRYTKCC